MTIRFLEHRRPAAGRRPAVRAAAAAAPAGRARRPARRRWPPTATSARSSTPSWRRARSRPAQHAQALEELQARVIDEVGDIPEPAAPSRPPPSAGLHAAPSPLLIPAGALALYGVLGTPAALAPRGERVAGRRRQAPHAMSREQMEAMVESLAEKLEEPQRRRRLAHAGALLRRVRPPARSRPGLRQANTLAPRDPQLLADYADALAMVNGRNLEGRPTELVMEALKLDPSTRRRLRWPAPRPSTAATSPGRRLLEEAAGHAAAGIGPGPAPCRPTSPRPRPAAAKGAAQRQRRRRAADTATDGAGRRASRPPASKAA